MSRIGKNPIAVPAGVTVTLDGNQVTVKGPKGELSRSIPADMKVTQEDGNDHGRIARLMKRSTRRFTD